MRQFAELFAQLDQTNKTNEKLALLKSYFANADEQDSLWAIALFSHKRPKRQINTRSLREIVIEYTGIQEWLFEESYHTVGDLAETISLLLPSPVAISDTCLSEWMAFLQGLKKLDEEEKKRSVLHAWMQMDTTERLVFNKLITGAFRIGVSSQLVIRALSEHLSLPTSTIAHRLMGDWTPETTNFQQLLLSTDKEENLSKPYPFYLAYALESAPQDLGEPSSWQAEWKWDGIRSQTIFRGGELFIWSRGEELLTEKFPELHILKEFLPDGIVIDGEILPYKAGSILPFNELQTRIGRKSLSKKLLEQVPVEIFAYDLLEWEGKDIRNEPLSSRRSKLVQLINSFEPKIPLKLSSPLSFDSWNELELLQNQARSYYAEGCMLKYLEAPYQVGRKKGDWWKWKLDPLTIDAVLIYAQKGHGRRADLYSDYTFAVWNGDHLVPFTKAYSGLSDKEMQEVDQYVKKNTLERFGPVRTVRPALVFEIAFEGIQASNRHKSGVALRFPRIKHWRKDKPLAEANTLKDLQQLLEVYGKAQD